MKFTPIVFAICAFAASSAVASPIPANTDCVRYCRAFWGVCSVKLCGNGWQRCLDNCKASQATQTDVIPTETDIIPTETDVIPTETDVIPTQTQNPIPLGPVTITLTNTIPTETQKLGPVDACVRRCHTLWGVCTYQLCGDAPKQCIDGCSASQPDGLNRRDETSTKSFIPVDPPLSKLHKATATQSFIPVDPPLSNLHKATATQSFIPVDPPLSNLHKATATQSFIPVDPPLSKLHKATATQSFIPVDPPLSNLHKATETKSYIPVDPPLTRTNANVIPTDQATDALTSCIQLCNLKWGICTYDLCGDAPQQCFDNCYLQNQ